MYGLWRKTDIPHRNRRRKTLQPQKATAATFSLVKILKPPSPHKDKKKQTTTQKPMLPNPT
jgi:hypothetical protein